MNSPPQISCFTVGRTEWLTVFNAGAPLERLRQALDQECQVLRVTPRRRTVRVAGQPAVIVKHFLTDGVLAWLKSMIRGDPAFREWTALRLASSRRLPVPKPLAVSRQNKLTFPRESFLVTEELANAVTLADYLYGILRPTGRIRQQVVEEAGRVLRRAHDAGMFHKDLHLGNLMIRRAESGPEVFLIDLQRVVFRSQIGIKAKLTNLAELHGGCAEASRAERLRFLKAYLANLLGATDGLRAFLVRLEAKALKHRSRMWRSRQKRCLIDNRDFLRLGSAEYAGCVSRVWNVELLALARPAKLLASCALVKDSRTTTVAAGDLCDLRFHIKRYNYQGVGYALKNLLRSCRAKRAWLAANACLLRRVPVAAPIAYLERRHFRFLLDSYLVCKTVDGKTLSATLHQHGLPLSDKREIIAGLARYLARMHEHQVANRDLKSDNLIVTKTGTSRYGFSAVDFDGLRIGPVSRRTRIKNLARLLRECRTSPAATRTDCLRFLQSYLGGRFEEQWRSYWRAAQQRSQID